MKQRFFSMLVLLAAVVTGAMAQTPELLVTIESNGKGTSSQTFDGKAILTFGGGTVGNDNDNWGWYNRTEAEEITLTVTGADGYTVTSCTFYTNSSSKTVEGEHPTVYVTGSPCQTYTATGKGGNSLGVYGVTKIEVYGYAPPTFSATLAEGTEDADKWTVKVGEGEAQAFPVEGLNGGETVTVTYSGEKKVKSVKAVKKAAAPAYTLLSAATAEDVGKVVCAAGHLHDAKTAVPDGCTAVGILGKVTETGNGLILALQDATSQTWNTINGWTSSTIASTTLKLMPDDAARGTNLTSYTKLGDTTVSDWAVAQKSDYVAIFENLGSTKSDEDGTTYDGNVNAYITTGVGGTAIDGHYWSATKKDFEKAWGFASSFWSGYEVQHDYSVRPVLGFYTPL